MRRSVGQWSLPANRKYRYRFVPRFLSQRMLGFPAGAFTAGPAFDRLPLPLRNYAYGCVRRSRRNLQDRPPRLRIRDGARLVGSGSEVCFVVDADSNSAPTLHCLFFYFAATLRPTFLNACITLFRGSYILFLRYSK